MFLIRVSMGIKKDPKMEVPTIYIRPICQAYVSEYRHNSYGQKYGTFTYLHQLDPGDLPLRVGMISGPFLEQNLDL